MDKIIIQCVLEKCRCCCTFSSAEEIAVPLQIKTVIANKIKLDGYKVTNIWNYERLFAATRYNNRTRPALLSFSR